MEDVDLPPGGPQATERALARVRDARGVVLVEGFSDQIALEALAARRGRDLVAEHVAIVPIGGAQAIARFLAGLRREHPGLTLAGLCDEREAHIFRRSLERAGMARHGFHVCVRDLEDELIRAVGPAAVEALLDANRELGAFRTFQKQPAWRGRAVADQLRRFMGSADRRKLRYARLLVEAVEPEHVPAPLDRVLAAV